MMLGAAARRSYFPTSMARRFPGYETRSSPYRRIIRVSPLPVRYRGRGSILGNRLSTRLPASPRGPLIVELFTPRDFPWSPKQSRSGMACHQAHGSRRRTTLNAPLGKRTPRMDLITSSDHTILNIDGLQQNTTASLSVSPRIGARKEQVFIG